MPRRRRQATSSARVPWPREYDLPELSYDEYQQHYVDTMAAEITGLHGRTPWPWKHDPMNQDADFLGNITNPDWLAYVAHIDAVNARRWADLNESEDPE